MDKNVIIGINSVIEYIHNAPDKIDKVFIARGGSRFNELLSLCREYNIPYRLFEKNNIPGKYYKNLSRGVFALLTDQKILSLPDILYNYENKESNIMILFDRITNVGNAGAIIRSGIAFGIRDFIFEQNNSVSISSVLGTSSSGYSSLARIYRISSPSGLIKRLRIINVNIISVDMSGSDLSEGEFSYPMLIVLGSEDKGIRRTIIKDSDKTFRVPTEDRVESLNVSCAASIVFYEIFKRQRR